MTLATDPQIARTDVDFVPHSDKRTSSEITADNAPTASGASGLVPVSQLGQLLAGAQDRAKARSDAAARERAEQERQTSEALRARAQFD